MIYHIYIYFYGVSLFECTKYSSVCHHVFFLSCILVICQSVKYSSSIRTVDFTGCNLTWRGAEYMANIIKVQYLVFPTQIVLLFFCQS